MSSTMKICNRHEKQVPLLWTFAFPGSEYWCPYCGGNWGMLGAGENVEVTFALKRAKVEWTHKSKEFLHARGVSGCSSLEWEGKRISPEDLPDEEKERLQKIIDEWEYEADKETTEQ